MRPDYARMCPRYEAAAELLGKKWVGLVIRVLLGGPKRFGDFREQLPYLSDRLLSERLKHLEEQGIVTRAVHDTRPVHVEYQLTEKGKQLEPVFCAIQDWAERWY